jgi:hypothetical protein
MLLAGNLARSVQAGILIGAKNLSSTLKGGLRLFFGFKISLPTYLGLRYSEIILYIRK